jgi:HEAT repeats
VSESQLTKPGPSRKAIIGWTVGMLAVLGLVWFASAVVWPVWRTRLAVQEYVRQERQYPRGVSRRNIPPRLKTSMQAAVGTLPSASQLALYVKMPDWAAPNKDRAFHLFAFCEDRGVPELADLLMGGRAQVRQWAANELAWCGKKAEAAVRALERATGDEDAGVRQTATYALEAIRDPDKALPTD